MKVGAGLFCALALLVATPAAAVVVVAAPAAAVIPVKAPAAAGKAQAAGQAARGDEPLVLLMLAAALGIVMVVARSARQMPTVSA